MRRKMIMQRRAFIRAAMAAIMAPVAMTVLENQDLDRTGGFHTASSVCCPTCRGTDTIKCPVCNGVGKVGKKPCGSCKGSKKLVCPKCGGAKRIYK